MEDVKATPTPLRNADTGSWTALDPSQAAGVSDVPPGSPRIYDAYHDITYSLPGLSHAESAACSACDINMDIPPQQPIDPEWGTFYKSLEPRWRLDYMDFSPDCSEIPGGLAQKCTSFRDLVDQANGWLKQNPGLSIECCESVVRPSASQAHVGDTEPMWYDTGGPERCSVYSMSLRLWVCPSCRGRATQLEYKDFVAAETDTVSHLIRKVNRKLEEHPVKGKIVSCEMIHVPSQTDPDPETTVWNEADQGACASERLCIRVFFRKDGGTSCQNIGIKTFFPDLKRKPPETAAQMLRRATCWLAMEPFKRALNIQSVFVPFADKENPENNTERCYRPVPDFCSLEYLQIVRVLYTEPASPQLPRSRKVTCKLFSPVQYHPDPNAAYEQMRHTLIRINAWLEATGADLLCAESFMTSFPPATQSSQAITEVVHWQVPKKCSESRLLMHIRLYIEGDYSEPDPRILPPKPISTTICETLARHRDQRRQYLEKRKRKKRKKLIIGLTLVILVVVGMVIFLDQTLNLIGI